MPTNRFRPRGRIHRFGQAESRQAEIGNRLGRQSETENFTSDRHARRGSRDVLGIGLFFEYWNWVAPISVYS